MPKKKLTLCVFIDAFGWEILQHHRFLDDALTTKAPLDTVLGYSSTCIPAILTGKMPREHGHLSFFRYDPENSPFGACRCLTFLPRSITRRGRVRRVMSKVIQKFYGYTGYFQIYNMPFDVLPLFDYSEKRDLYKPGGINSGDRTIFDHLRERKIPFHISDWRAGEDDNFKSLERKLQIHVDFSRPLTIADIRSWPRWLMWKDLLDGHIILFGQYDILTSNAPDSLYDPLPAIEATRLLLNRGAGLLWASRVLRGAESAPDADFVRRNYFKCSLGLGDALLIAHETYSTSYRGRDLKLAELARTNPDVASLDVESIYRDALLFKFRPDDTPEVILSQSTIWRLAQLWGAVFLHVERLRTGRSLASLDEYSRWRSLREPEQHAITALPRNVIRNLQLGRLSWRYPRERLYRLLPALLGLTVSEPSDWNSETEKFLAEWMRFN